MLQCLPYSSGSCLVSSDMRFSNIRPSWMRHSSAPASTHSGKCTLPSWFSDVPSVQIRAKSSSQCRFMYTTENANDGDIKHTSLIARELRAKQSAVSLHKRAEHQHHSALPDKKDWCHRKNSSNQTSTCQGHRHFVTSIKVVFS